MKKSWKNYIITAILCNFIAHCVELHGEDGVFLGGESTSGVDVQIRAEDANRHRREHELQMKLTEVESLLRREQLAKENLQKQLDSVQEELIEITERYQKQNKQYDQLRLVMTGAIARGKILGSGEREDELLGRLNSIAKDGEKLALEAVEFCEQVRELLHDLPIGKVKQAQIQLNLDQLMRRSRQFVMLTNPEPAKGDFSRSRILAVSRELSVVILPVGSVHGVFNGLIYYVGKSDTVLKVVGVRPFVAAALLMTGNIEDLTPGMEVATEKK